jgi:hypothetical protein
MSVEDGVLDPAHGEESMGAAGIAKPEADKPEIKVSEDGNVAEHNGVKYVRQEALHQERQRAQKLADTLSALDPVMPEFKEFLEQKHARRGATVDRAARGNGGSDDYSQDELEGFAITRGYYKDDNTTPDTSRAQKELDIISGISRRQVGKAVAPVAAGTTREQARVNRERAIGNRFVDGRPVADEKYMRAALDTLGEDQIADPNVANLAQVVAAGLEYLDQRKNGTSTRGRRGGEPMFTERGTGRYDTDAGDDVSPLSAAAARARGKTPEQWAKLSKQVNKTDRGSALLEEV